MSLAKGSHTTDDIDGVRCSIIETEATKERVDFLTPLLEHNGYEVKVIKNDPPPPPKAKSPVEGEEKENETEVPQVEEPLEEIVETYTIGVTNILFDPVMSVFDRSMKRPDGEIVSPAYWSQQDSEKEDWYWKGSPGS